VLVQNYDLVSFRGLTASCISTSHVLFFKDKFKCSELPVSQNSSMFRYLFNNNITSQAQTTSQELMSQPLLEGSRTMPAKQSIMGGDLVSPFSFGLWPDWLQPTLKRSQLQFQIGAGSAAASLTCHVEHS